MKRILIIAAVLLIVIASAAFLLFRQKAVDPNCDSVAKEASKNSFYQKADYSRAYQNCLNSK